MGNTPISTSTTNIYYPSNWLIEGGPPPNVNCPINDADNSWAADNDISITIREGKEKPWWVVCQDRILMETSEPSEVAAYILSYTNEYRDWLVNNEVAW